MTPARRHRERALAALQGAANPQFDQVRANAYELQLMQLAEHRRTLKGIQSIERKIDAKRPMLAVYKPWIDGLLAADRGGQDDVLVTVMLWHLDTGDLEGAFPMADYVIRHGLSTPDRYERTAATMIAEEVADSSGYFRHLLGSENHEGDDGDDDNFSQRHAEHDLRLRLVFGLRLDFGNPCFEVPDRGPEILADG